MTPDTREMHIDFGLLKIPFTLIYKSRKSLGIKVHPDSRVEVLAPEDTSDEKVYQKVKSKASWILKQLEHFSSYNPKTPPRKYVSGETHLYLGRQYKLKVVESEEATVKLLRGQLLVLTTDTSPVSIEKILSKWYTQKASIIYDELLKAVYPKFNKYNITEPELTIRSMSKRWGSCTHSGKIILNKALIKASKGCIEYVIIHELCHLIHHNHTKAFYNLQSVIMPDWEKWKDRLETTLA